METSCFPLARISFAAGSFHVEIRPFISCSHAAYRTAIFTRMSLIDSPRQTRARGTLRFLPAFLFSSQRNCNALHSPFLFQLHCHSAHLFSLIEVRKSKFHLVFEFIFGLTWKRRAGRESGGCTSNLNDNIYHAPHLSSLPLEALSLFWHRQAH